MPFHSTRSPPRREGSRRHFFVSVGGVSSSSPFVFDSLLLFQGRLRQRRWLLLFPVRKIGRRTTTTTTTTTRVLPRVTVVPSVLPPLVKSGHDVDRKVSSHQRSGGRDTKILNFFPQTVFVFRVLCTFFLSPLSLSLSLSLCPYKTTHHYYIARNTTTRAKRESNKERAFESNKERSSIEGNSSRVHPTKREGVREEALCVFESCVNWKIFQKRRRKATA